MSVLRRLCRTAASTFRVMSDPATKRSKMDAESGSASGSGTQRTSTPPTIIFNQCEERFAPIVNTTGFVDKTLFIKAFMQAAESEIVVLAPRRFGKSTNLDMVREFVSGNRDIFQNLKICKQEWDFFDENCKEHPVISLDFRTVGGKTKDAVLQTLKIAIGNAYSDNRHLVTKAGENYIWARENLENARITVEKFVKYWKNPENLTQVDVTYGLKILSECLELHHGKPVYVFIDEFDAPVMNAITETNPDKKELERTIDLLRAVISAFLKGNNKYVKKALITGCVGVAQTLLAHANNIAYYEFLRKPSFAPYFGFTDKEVTDLFEKEEFRSYRNDAEIKKWYNGYKLMHTNEFVIYSGYSILKYLLESRKMKKPTFSNYWVQSGGISNLNELFAKSEIRKHIENLIYGQEVPIKAINKINKTHILQLKLLIHDVVKPANADLFLYFLLQNGYLNVVKHIGENITLKIPNQELKEMFMEECYNVDFFEAQYQINPEQREAYEKALCSLLEQGDVDDFKSFANAVSALFSNKDPTNEAEFHSVLFSLAFNVKRLEARSEMRTRRLKTFGILDILVVLRNAGIIIEIKYINDTSVIAHQQIVNKQYYTAFSDEYEGVTKKIFIGLHMAKDRKVSLTYSFGANEKTFTVTSD